MRIFATIRQRTIPTTKDKTMHIKNEERSPHIECQCHTEKQTVDMKRESDMKNYLQYQGGNLNQNSQ